METIQGIIGWVVINQGALVEGAWWVLVGLGTLAALTPTESDDRMIGRLKNLLGKLRRK